MNAKRLMIGSLVGLVSLYIVGYLFWEVILTGFFATNVGSAVGVERETQIFWSIALGTLFYGVLLTLALESQSGATSLVGGLKVGALVGFLLWGTTDFELYGLQNVSTLTGAIADTALEAVRGGVCGAIIAVVLGKIGDQKTPPQPD